MKKIAVVTGVTSGIGLAIACRLLRLDYSVYGVGRNFYKCIFFLEDPDFEPIICDLSKYQNIETMVKSLPENIDVLINSAGIGYFGFHEEINAKKIHEMISVNLEAPLILTQLLLRKLKKNSGRVINISSITAKKSSPIGVAYSSTKAGITHFSRGLYDEARKYGIKVCAIHPDMTKTSFYNNQNFDCSDDDESYILSSEVANCVEFILTQKSNITDITIEPQFHKIKRK